MIIVITITVDNGRMPLQLVYRDELPSYYEISTHLIKLKEDHWQHIIDIFKLEPGWYHRQQYLENSYINIFVHNDRQS